MIGKLNRQTVVIDRIIKYFASAGFNIIFGDEIVLYENNFKKLNVPDDSFITMKDATLYLTDEVLLRSHLSTVWIQELTKHKNEPHAFLEIGKVYRHEENTINTLSVFYQGEGVIIGERISLADLKGIMQDFVNYMFPNMGEMVFSPWWHPFTNLGVAINLKCNCGSDINCPICKGVGLIDIATAGMINENILKVMDIDSKYSALCFGLGPTRMTQIIENVSLRDLSIPLNKKKKVYYDL